MWLVPGHRSIAAHELCSVCNGHVCIEQDHGKGLRISLFQRPRPVVRLMDKISLVAKREPDEFSNLRIVIDDEHRSDSDGHELSKVILFRRNRIMGAAESSSAECRSSQGDE